MGFIIETGNSATSTVYAIHTTAGRRIISSNDEAYNISKWSLADDEINYQFMNSDLSIDREDDDLANWVILEPSSRARNELKNKIYVNKAYGSPAIEAPQSSNKYILTQLTTGAQGILNASDPTPMFMFAMQTIINNPATLQKDIQINAYEIEINNTANYVDGINNDFFDFFLFSMVSPDESTSFVKRTDTVNSVKYVFNTRNSAGEQYEYNQLGVKVVEMSVGLDAASQKYKNWIYDYKLMNPSSNLLYKNMVTVRAIGNITNFDTYTVDTTIQSLTFDVLVKL